MGYGIWAGSNMLFGSDLLSSHIKRPSQNARCFQPWMPLHGASHTPRLHPGAGPIPSLTRGSVGMHWLVNTTVPGVAVEDWRHFEFFAGAMANSQTYKFDYEVQIGNH